MSGLLLGAIADDFSGATDLAEQLVADGMRTVQLIGAVDQPVPGDVDAVVIALKTRTIPSDEAVAQSLHALDVLERAGARQIAFKYGSTFDSTPRGNIGPVADALAERLDQTVTVFCPANPANKRTVYNGYLFVGDALLSESEMRDHPRTPMRDANIVRLLAAQSRRPVTRLELATIRRGGRAIASVLAELARKTPAHVVVDVTENADLYALAEALDGARLVTGSAGVAIGLPSVYRRHGWLDVRAEATAPPVRGGRAAVIAGSASAVTRAQVAALCDSGVAAFSIEPEHLADPPAAVEAAVAWAAAHAPDPVVVNASGDAAIVRAAQQRYGANEAGERVESILAGVAAGLVSAGVRRLVVSGGETSGAVVRALGIASLRIGPRIEIGVPWTVAPTAAPLGLALKNGNHGEPDFFLRALASTQEPSAEDAVPR